MIKLEFVYYIYPVKYLTIYFFTFLDKLEGTNDVSLTVPVPGTYRVHTIQ